MFNFENVPNKAGTIKRAIDKVAINRTGQLAFPLYFVEKNSIRSYKSAELFWDQDRQVLAIVFREELAEQNYPIKFTEKYGASIKTAKRFFDGRFDYKKFGGRFPYDKLSGEVAGIASAQVVYVVDLKRKEENEEERVDK